MTTFDQAAQLTEQAPGSWTAQAPADWVQGRTIFGGLGAAYAATAARLLVAGLPGAGLPGAGLPGAERPIRSLDVAFVAPLNPGQVQVDAQVLAAGKAVSQLTVDLRGEDGSLSTRAHVVTGAARVSNVTVAALGPASPDAEKDPDSAGIEFPYLEGITPVFTQHMAMRWCGPAFPYTGSGPEGAVVRAWVQHRTQATGLGAVLALMDACPPAILPLVSQAAPASTVRWTAHLVADLPPDVTGRWFWYEAETVQARDGYAIEESRLFLDGALVAWSEQLVAVFDRPSAS